MGIILNGTSKEIPIVASATDELLLIEELIYGEDLAHLAGTNIPADGYNNLSESKIYKYYGKYYRIYNINKVYGQDHADYLVPDGYGVMQPNPEIFWEIKLNDLSNKTNKIGDIKITNYKPYKPVVTPPGLIQPDDPRDWYCMPGTGGKASGVDPIWDHSSTNRPNYASDHIVNKYYCTDQTGTSRWNLAQPPEMYTKETMGNKPRAHIVGSNYQVAYFDPVTYKPLYDVDNTVRPVNERKFYSCQAIDRADNINEPEIKSAYTGKYTVENGVYYDTDHDPIDITTHVIYGTDVTPGHAGSGRYRIIAKDKAVPYTYTETYYTTESTVSCGFWCVLGGLAAGIAGLGIFSIPFAGAAVDALTSEDTKRVEHTRTRTGTKYVPTRYLVDVNTNAEQEIIADKDWKSEYNGDKKYIKESTIDPNSIYNEKDLLYDSNDYVKSIANTSFDITLTAKYREKYPVVKLPVVYLDYDEDMLVYNCTDDETAEIDSLEVLEIEGR